MDNATQERQSSTSGESPQMSNLQQSSSDANSAEQIQPEQQQQSNQPLSDYELYRRQKQNFLIENVVNLGYDTTAFTAFMNSKKENGVEIDNWSFPSLVRQVRHFKRTQEPGYVLEDDQLLLQEQEEDQIEFEREQAKLHQQQQHQQDAKLTQASFGSTANESGFEHLSYEDDAGPDFSRMSQQNSTDFDDCPKLRMNDYLACKAVADQRCPLNFRRTVVKVINHEIKKGGFFASDYALFTIETDLGSSQRIKVQRKDEDFYKLRQFLKKQFHYVVAPPLPAKNAKLQEKIIVKRQKHFTRFLQALCRSEIFKSSQFLHAFLTTTDLKQFQGIIKAEERIKNSKQIKDLITEDGRANVKLLENSTVFCSKMNAFIETHQVLYQDVIDITKEVHDQTNSVAESFVNLSKSLEKISELNRMIDVDRQFDLFSFLSKMIHGTSTHLQNTSELVKMYCGSHLKYHLWEHEGMRELFQVREQYKNSYMKRERALIEKKEKLFKTKDYRQWMCTAVSLDELRDKSEELYKNKDKAFKFMCTEESRELNNLREELSFYTNQCLSEIQRVGTDNGQLLTDHFITMAQIECAYINHHHVDWADFMSHFTQLQASEERPTIPIRTSQPSFASEEQKEAPKVDEQLVKDTAAVPEREKDIESKPALQSEVAPNKKAEEVTAEKASTDPADLAPDVPYKTVVRQSETGELIVEKIPLVEEKKEMPVVEEPQDKQVAPEAQLDSDQSETQQLQEAQDAVQTELTGDVPAQEEIKE